MLPSPAKRAWTMNPRPEWVVTVRKDDQEPNHAQLRTRYATVVPAW